MSDWKVKRYRTGRDVQMGDGSQQPEEFFTVKVDGHVVGSGQTNCSTFCCPEPLGIGRGLNATDEQIAFAVTHDESIFG